MFVLCNSCGYFIFDSIIEYYYNTNDILLNLHHVVVVITTVMSLRNKYSGFEYMLSILCAEASNPYLVIRTTLRITGKKQTSLYANNDLVFAAVFLLMRLIICPLLLLMCFESPHCIYAAKLGVCIVLFVSLLWAYKIFKGIFELIKKSYESDNNKMPGYLKMIHGFVMFVNGKGMMTNIYHAIVFCIIVMLP